MAQIVLILGESGTGKSASMRNFDAADVALVNVGKKPLPFRGKFETLISSDADEIINFMKKTDKKVIVIDDAQYIMAFQYMRRMRETGWDKFNDIQGDFFNVLDAAKELDENKIVFFLSHLETKDDGRQKIKTIGKMLDEKITIEGLFTVVLKTYVADGKYYFVTQNSGMDTVKSPIGMFPAVTIDNDLKYVAEKIRNYYYMDGAKTDAEMEKADEAVKADVDPTEKKRRTRKSRSEAEKETVSVTVVDQKGEDVVEVPVVKEESTEEKPVTRRRRKARNTEAVKAMDEFGKNVPADEELPF